MKDTILILVAVAGLGSAIYADRVDKPRAIAALLKSHAAELADSREREAHLEEQLEKSQADAADLAEQLRALRAGSPVAATATAPTVPVPVPVPGAAAMPSTDQAEAALAALDAWLAKSLADLEAQTTAPQRQLAEARARRDQVAALAGPFTEQRVDPKTGRKSGIRTSDADRARWESHRAAELARLDTLMADANRRLNDLAAQRARLQADYEARKSALGR